MTLLISHGGLLNMFLVTFLSPFSLFGGLEAAYNIN